MNNPAKTLNVDSSRKPVITLVLVLLFLVFFNMLLYTFLHEGGHALAGLLFGGKIIDFNVNFWNLSAHVGFDGEFSNQQDVLVSAAGISVPVLVWLGFILLVPLKAPASLQWLKLVGTMVVLNSLLAWIIIPAVYLAGQKPSDDSTHFLETTGASPLLVSLVVLVVYISGWLIFLRQSGGITGIRLTLQRSERLIERSSLRALAVMIAAASVLSASALGLGAIARQAGPLHVPEEYTQVAEINMAERSYSDETVYTLTLRQTSTVQLYYLLENIYSGPLEIALISPDGVRKVLFAAGENFATDISTVNPDAQVLQPGNYQLKLTFPRTKGKLTVYTLVSPSLNPQVRPE